MFLINVSYLSLAFTKQAKCPQNSNAAQKCHTKNKAKCTANILYTNYPHFFRLEMMTFHQIYTKKKHVIDDFIRITSQMVKRCQAQPPETKLWYYDYSNTKENTLMNTINKWQDLRNMLLDIGVVTLRDKQYPQLWK